MPRPTKCRRVCHYPETLEFIPRHPGQEEPVVLTVDEFEVIRLMDHQGLSQEEAGCQMGVARTTVQRIYESARKKLAAVLVCGAPLRIEGGDYRLCNGTDPSCPRGDCKSRTIPEHYSIYKGDYVMRIAVTYENEEIFQHFGHTQQFKIYDVENDAVTASQVVDTNGSGHGALAGILQALHVDVLICGGIGGGAQAALAEAGIRLYGGVRGNADEAVDALLSGSLNYNPEVKCSHHDHEHGGEGHTCGRHGCGHHSCGNH